MKEIKRPTRSLLSFSLSILLLFLVAHPLPRALAIRNPKIGVMEEVADQGVTASSRVVKGDGVVMERMEIEVNDYPPSGANSRHDPRSPGKP